MTFRQADVASLRMLRKARDRIDREYREDISVAALASGRDTRCPPRRGTAKTALAEKPAGCPMA